jgi:hypothetical protein
LRDFVNARLRDYFGWVLNREGVCGAEAVEKGVLRLCTIVILGWGGKKGLEAGEDGTLCHKVAWVAVDVF